MKNYLVFLVTIGMAAAYWYQIPEPPKEVAVATPAPTVVPPPAPVDKKPVTFHSALDAPATATGGKKVQSSVLLGDDKPSHLHP